MVRIFRTGIRLYRPRFSAVYITSVDLIRTLVRALQLLVLVESVKQGLSRPVLCIQ